MTLGEDDAAIGKTADNKARSARAPRRCVVLSGTVVSGDRRGGRELGFPTANVELDADGVALPSDGVYSGWFEGESGTRHLAAISIGTRPTYYGEHGIRLAEAYLLDFDGDLYGQHVTLGLEDRVREQVQFSGNEDLISQMHRDVEVVRRRARGLDGRSP
ncbi:MAG: riboflavin kinase [Acidimicrobiales bacterium]